MKKIYLSCLAIGLSVASFAQTVVTIKDADLAGGQTYNWTNDKIYLLDGFVYMESGSTLNIQEGTVIKGKGTPTTSDLASTLIICRGAKINAIGTAENPIIFTAEDDNLGASPNLGVNNRGQWGGLLILGSAKVGDTGGEDNIEGLPETDPRALYGGSNDGDNSGTLRYVSIRYTGAELLPDEEIQGLTLGGVGSGTTIEYVESLSSNDDGIEIFGGAVNVKWFVSAFSNDEAFDYDEGWRGFGQFWFAITGYDKGDQCGEHDGPEGTSTLLSYPRIFNATYIGPGDTAKSVKSPRVIHFKSKGSGVYGNSIFAHFAKNGLELEDKPAGQGDDSYAIMLRDSIQMLNNLWYSAHWTHIDSIVTATAGAEDATAAQLKTKMTGAWGNTILNSSPLMSVGWGFDDFGKIQGSGDLWPMPSAPEAFTNLASYPSSSFFTQVGYKGAFDGFNNWAKGWTGLDYHGFFENHVSIEELEAGFEFNVYPNPTSGVFNVELNVEKSQDVNVIVFDVTGKVVENTPVAKLGAGTHNITLSADAYTAGVYTVEVRTASGSKYSKLVVK